MRFSTDSLIAALRTFRVERQESGSNDEGEAVVAYVAKNPGQSVEQIGKALGTSTKDLALPIIRMLDEKRLSKKGERRGTRYFTK